jgi:cytochrome c peroxidase
MKMSARLFVFILLITALVVNAGTPKFAIDEATRLPGGIGALTAPPPEDPDNPSTPEKVELGRLLFFDKRLSGNQQSSCGTCHIPEKGFADGEKTSIGGAGKRMPRHTPTILNASYNAFQSWDGKFRKAEDHVTSAMNNPINMNLPDEAELISRLEAVPQYRTMFREVFDGQPPTRALTARAIGAYMRTLTTGNSPFDHYARGDKSALTDAQKRGLTIYVGKGRCSACHLGPNFTDNKFHALGLPGEDVGRFKWTNDEKDRASFKTPTLRNVAITAPYMHDGSVATLADVIELYNRGGGEREPKSELLGKLGLTDAEKRDLIAFLESLTGTPTPAGMRPATE